MTALALTITQAGLQRFTAAQLDDDVDLTISAVGFTDAAFVAAPTLTAIPGELRRVGAISGEAVGDGIVHIVVRDDGAVAYTVRGLGLFLADGTLFAAYAQADPIVGKSAQSSLYLALDIAFPAGDVTQLTFGSTDFLNPPATTERLGVVELATLAEGQDGSDPLRVPAVSVVSALIAAAKAQLQAALVTLQSSILARRIDTSGLAIGGGDLTANRLVTVPAASAAEVLAAVTEAKAVTPAALGALAHLYGPNGYVTLPGGLILQWGQYRGATTSEIAVSTDYPIAFPNSCFARMAVGYIAGASTSKDLWVQIVGEPSLASLTVQYQQATGDRALDGFDWFAVGN